MITLAYPAIFMISLIVILGGGWFSYQLLRGERRVEARVRALHEGPQAGAAAAPRVTEAENIRKAVVSMLSSIGQWVLRRRMLSQRTLADLERSLMAAGLRGNAALRLFVGGKIVLLVLMPAILWVVAEEAHLSHLMHFALPGGGAVLGLLAPDFVLNRIRDRHSKLLSRELPDALDMMVICAQAGLGLGPTVLRVAEELAGTHRAVAVEFSQTADELQIMTDPQAALTNLGQRSGIDGVRRLATTLLQSAQYGTPLSDAIRSLSAELRTELVTRFEAKAARLPVLLTLPMVLFILPSLFLIVGGPAIIEVLHALKH